jgi:DNA repair exonuclease SbcCD ATPase subunit
MKETKKQIKAQLMNELTCKFERDTENIKERCRRLEQRNCELSTDCDTYKKENQNLKEENENLKAKLSQYKEWIDRMQDFCNLPEAERAPAFKTYLDGIEAKAKSDKELAAIGKFYQGIMSMFMV